MRVRNNKDHQITVSKSRKGISQIFDVQATEQDWRVGDAASQRSYDFVLSWELRDVERVCFIFGSPESNGQAEVERNAEIHIPASVQQAIQRKIITFLLAGHCLRGNRLIRLPEVGKREITIINL